MKNGIYLAWQNLGKKDFDKDFLEKYYHKFESGVKNHCLIIVNNGKMRAFTAMSENDIIENRKNYDNGDECCNDASRTGCNSLALIENGTYEIKRMISSDQNFIDLIWIDDELDEANEENISLIYFQCQLAQNILYSYPNVSMNFIKKESFEHFGKFASCNFDYKEYGAKFFA